MSIATLATAFLSCTALWALCAAQTYSSLADSDYHALLALNSSITNFETVAASPGFIGWQDTSPCPINGTAWLGVTCEYSSIPYRVTTLDLSVLDPGLVQGTLPAALGDLTAVSEVILQQQNFTGTLPPSWGANGSFAALQALVLGQNTLHGRLPEEWGASTRFQQLQTLNLVDNNFHGSLPRSWAVNGSFPVLTNLALDNNSLTGPLPGEWTEGFNTLLVLSAVDNSLTGPLPADWAFASLLTLLVNGNSLNGTLPVGYPLTLPALQTLDVSNNLLSGSIPKSWNNWTSLSTLNILPGNPGLCGEIGPHFLSASGIEGSPIIDPMQLTGEYLFNASNGGLLLSPCLVAAPAPAPIQAESL